MQGQKGLRQAGNTEITESHIQHGTYRSDRHMQVRDSLGTAQGTGWCEEVAMAATGDWSPTAMVMEGCKG